jgi:hypothetical protein
LATNKEITRVLGLLQAEWPNYPVTDQTVLVWQHAFADISANVLENAAWHIITTGSAFFPHVSEVRKTAFKLQNNIPDEATAFDEVRKAHDHYEIGGNATDGFWSKELPYKWSSPIVEATARRLGWPDNFPTDNIVADRAHFKQYYEALVDAAVEDGVMLPQIREFKNEQLADGIKQLADKMRMEE